jgi:uncharacterized protein YcbK (DUF882 family)
MRSLAELENFHPREWLCRCGCAKDTKDKLKLLVQAFIYILRRIYGQPIQCIISGPARCAKRNTDVKGATDSFHMGVNGRDVGKGAALDCVFRRFQSNVWTTIPKKDVAQHAIKSRLFGGVGWKGYPTAFTFVHLDLGPEREF